MNALSPDLLESCSFPRRHRHERAAFNGMRVMQRLISVHAGDTWSHFSAPSHTTTRLKSSTERFPWRGSGASMSSPSVGTAQDQKARRLGAGAGFDLMHRAAAAQFHTAILTEPNGERLPKRKSRGCKCVETDSAVDISQSVDRRDCVNVELPLELHCRSDACYGPLDDFLENPCDDRLSCRQARTLPTTSEGDLPSSRFRRRSKRDVHPQRELENRREATGACILCGVQIPTGASRKRASGRGPTRHICRPCLDKKCRSGDGH